MIKKDSNFKRERQNSTTSDRLMISLLKNFAGMLSSQYEYVVRHRSFTLMIRKVDMNIFIYQSSFSDESINYLKNKGRTDDSFLRKVGSF
jgi:hypothetical protein